MIRTEIRSLVAGVLEAMPILDMHTHLFPPSFGGVGLWGIDELVKYHYLEAELFRSDAVTPDEYWSLSPEAQADRIWQALFVRNAPISEATRGVVAVLKAFGLPTDSADLRAARAFFRGQKIEDHVKAVFKLAGITDLVMTNDPLDPAEAPCWLEGRGIAKGFHAVLRLDRILKGWADHWTVLEAQGYKVDAHFGGQSIAETRRFLADWCTRMRPLYMAVSLPNTFRYPDDSLTAQILRKVVIPSCREHGIPLALMIGPRYQTNPALRLAGDAVGHADINSVDAICRENPNNRFLVTMLSRENQHELAVSARKFSNMMVFGCWWFLNNPSIVEEMTRERIEMLGASFIPQHSDARVLEQLIYKWRNTRRTMTDVLANTYALMEEDGRPVTKEVVERDVARMFRGNFEAFTDGGRAMWHGSI